jgi:hypothetical protein
MSPLANSNFGPPGPIGAAVAPVPEPRNILRTLFGIVLFVGWGIVTFIWLASTVYLVGQGSATAALTAVSAVALLLLLGGMEGLEVSVIDRWQHVFPGRPPSFLAGWLAARQLFVALIVTAATLLANRAVVIVPGTSIRITNGLFLGVFDLLWTTLTVLWFAQILWKHLGATNPDRYLALLSGVLFPIVRVVHKVGISQPGEWAADWVEDQLLWSASLEELKPPESNHPLTHGAIWRELRRARRSERGPRPPAK